MDIVVALILGVIQGLTEFIPVSSTGHLLITGEIFSDRVEFSGFEFDVLLNIGTLTALLVYFSERIAKIISDISKGNYKLLRNVVISTIPAAVAGYFFKDTFSETLRSTEVVVFMLVTVGLLMIYEERVPKGKLRINKLDSVEATGIGLAQVLALVPGTSRSGSTILAGRYLGLSLKDAAEYSFLIAIPIVFGAITRVLFSDEGWDYLNNNLDMIIVGNVASFISGFLAVSFMLRFLSKKGLKSFGYYRLGLAAVVILIVNLV